MYPPSSGQVLVDGADLARMPADDWRARLAGAFQDFFRFEFRALRSVGVGDLPRAEERPAVSSAVDAKKAPLTAPTLVPDMTRSLGARRFRTMSPNT